MPKIGRNQECPCGSGKKFKHCCLGKIDWEALFAAPEEAAARHMTLRGKNLYFLNCILGELQLDWFNPATHFADIKRAFTPEVVRRIHSAILNIWPDLDDFERTLEAETGTVTALYTGNYQPEAVFRAVTRLSLYCDKIYLVDPFMHAERVRDDFNPILHPEQHRGNASKFAFLWLSLLPWIDAGVVNFVRPLTDFVPGLRGELLRMQRQRWNGNTKLKALAEEEADERMSRSQLFDRGFRELEILGCSETKLREFYRSMKDPPSSEDDFIRYIQRRRDEHPYFVEMLPDQTQEFIYQTTGAHYELAKRMCSITDSHIVTDMRTRWKEVELDREAAGIDLQGWSPFAKALHESELKMLNDVPLQEALRLREEERLESMRLFFRKVWKSCRNPNEFSEENALDLSAELREEVAKANEEWKKIDQDLWKWLSGTGAALISSGLVGFVPAASAAAVAGVTGLIQSRIKRRVFEDRYPAGFFLSCSS